MTEEKNNLNEIFSEIKELVADINYKVDTQSRKIKNLENKISILEKKEAGTEYSFANMTPPPPPPPNSLAPSDSEYQKNTQTFSDKLSNFLKSEDYTEKSENKKERTIEPTSMPVPPSSNQEVKSETTSLEEKIGGKWFAKIGMVVFVLGISFFLKYAFDNNWIGETGRVLLGVFVGLGFLAFGEKMIRKFFGYGQIITGGGLVILYLSIYAAQNFYGLIDQYGAFAFMSLITATGIALSLRYNAPALIIASTIGGFAVPFLTSTGENNIHGLFSYVILLDLAVLIVSFFKKWRWLNFVGMIGTFFIFSSWYGSFYTKAQLSPVMIYLTVFFIIYSISSLAYNLFKKENSSGIEQLMTLATGFVYFATSYNLLNNLYHDYLGYFAFVLALYYFAWAYAIKYFTPKDVSLYNFLAFFSVGFLTIAIPIQFSKYTITLLWIIEAVLLFYAGLKVIGHTGRMLKLFASSVLGLALLRVLIVDQGAYQKTDLLLVNKVFITSLIAVLAFYLLAFMFRKFSNSDEGKGTFWNKKAIISSLLVLASFFTVFGVTRDIVFFYKHQIRLEYDRVAEINLNIKTQYGNRAEAFEKVDQDVIKGLNERKEATISIFWLLYGALIMIIGVFAKERDLMKFGVLLNIAIIVRLFFYDLWQLDTIARPLVSFFTILISYLSAVIYYEYGKENKDDVAFGGYKKIIVVFLLAANILTIFAVSREIYLVFEKQKDSLQQEINTACNSPYSKFSSMPGMGIVNNSAECQDLQAKAKTLENKASIMISLFWLLYAIILITIGFARRYKWVRIGGIALLIVAIIKLFIVDLWSLGQLYRIIAFTSLGLVLLGVSYFYQKHKDVFKEIIK